MDNYGDIVWITLFGGDRKIYYLRGLFQEILREWVTIRTRVNPHGLPLFPTFYTNSPYGGLEREKQDKVGISDLKSDYDRSM